ncbi:hypothetical protein [Streptomyces sp. PU-14G]|uniref:hypothetical protein n=1 Tax=Streptomyces sp. PU-14G TaxID=2800808 RepID=UPI0034E005A2
MTATTLEERILRLEDIAAIRDLTARYADAINKGWNGKTVDADAIPNLFAADARWESFDGEVTHGAGLSHGIGGVGDVIRDGNPRATATPFLVTAMVLPWVAAS